MPNFSKYTSIKIVACGSAMHAGCVGKSLIEEYANMPVDVEIASEFGAKRCLKLPVSAPFHSPLMQPAAETMARAFMEVETNDALIPIVANVLADAETNKKDIIKNLVEQVTGTVRWRETMAYMSANGVTDLVELGAGKVLSGMAKRCLKDVNSFSVYSPSDIEELAKNL